MLAVDQMSCLSHP